jgi:hypothetical protein
MTEMKWDQRQARLTKPCKECPFRCKSIAGYMGGYDLETYRQPTSIGMPTTCHMSDFGAGNPRSTLCAGSLATIANDPYVDPLFEYKDAVEAIGKREDCFETVEAFSEYHKDAAKRRTK